MHICLARPMTFPRTKQGLRGTPSTANKDFISPPDVIPAAADRRLWGRIEDRILFSLRLCGFLGSSPPGAEDTPRIVLRGSFFLAVRMIRLIRSNYR
ncbi:hypothetical protein MLD38_021606 [Melastoma candidum]|uniref:Uncharacterized protein n=1 Tax=Melastoma candidum TaxID=119954 RepID=A0ACB9QGT8_9MYRT|nr:hypothetical protein MLD38_021606 [Melastoma candidum]